TPKCRRRVGTDVPAQLRLRCGVPGARPAITGFPSVPRTGSALRLTDPFRSHSSLCQSVEFLAATLVFAQLAGIPASTGWANGSGGRNRGGRSHSRRLQRPPGEPGARKSAALANGRDPDGYETLWVGNAFDISR